MRKCILTIEDNKDICEAVRYNLEKEKDFSVVEAHTGEDGVNLAFKLKPSLIILDLMLPGVSGFEICRILRRDPETQQIPILILSARSAESDKVLGLELGANDYMTKPFGVRELVARVRTTLRKSDASEMESYNDGRLDVHFENYEVCFEGEDRRLTFKEFGLLKVLILNAGRALTREKILNAVWGYSYYGDVRTVDVHIRRIRRKLGPSFKDYIETITGVGYRFRRPAQAQAGPAC